VGIRGRDVIRPQAVDGNHHQQRSGFSCASVGHTIAKNKVRLKTARNTASILFGFIIVTCRFPYGSI